MTHDLPPLPVAANWSMRLVVGLTTLLVVTFFAGIWSDLGKPFPGFFLSPWHNAGPIRSAHLGAGAPRADDRLLEINREPLRTLDQLWAPVADLSPDQAPIYTFDHGDKLYRVRIAPRPLDRPLFASSFGPIVLVGIAYWLMALVVYRMRPDLEASRAFVHLASAIAITASGIPDACLHHRLAPVWMAAFAFCGGALLRLGLVFPTRLPQANRPWIRRMPLLVSGVIAALMIVCYGLLKGLGWAEAAVWGQLLSLVSSLWFVIGTLLGLGLLLVQARITDTVGFRQLQVVAAGAVAAFTPLLGFNMVPYVLGMEPLLTLNGAALWLVLLPMALSVAILRYGLWDVRLLARKSASYALTGLVLAAVYGAVMMILETTLLADQTDHRWVEFTTAVTVALLLVPVRERVNQMLARFFFRTGYDASVALEQTAENLATTLELDRVAEQVMAVVNQTLYPSGGCLLMIDGDDGHYRPLAATGLGPSVTLAVDSPLVQTALTNRLIISRRLLPCRRRHIVEARLADVGAELMVPLVYQAELIGLLLLGTKRAEEAYAEADLGLLRTLAGQAALALHNARQMAQTKAINQQLEHMVAERTRALEAAMNDLQTAQSRLVQSEKMVSLGLLVAGVAHEINNPASVIIGNLELIKETQHDLHRLLSAYDGLELSSHMAEMIESIKGEIRYPELLGELEAMTRDCTDAGRRIRAIVADLRNFSRLRSDKPMAATDVRQGLQTTLNLVRSLFKKDQVTLHADLTDVPLVLGDSSQLNQVFMNLLINAAQAIEGRGDVFISLRQDGESIVITVTDTGCGIAPEHLARLFDPFFTTKKQGVGTGLGLSISYGIIERHGGRIEVASELGHGSTFTVRLPGLHPAALETADAER